MASTWERMMNKKNEHYELLEIEGIPYVCFRKAPRGAIKEWVWDVLTDEMDMNTVETMGGRYPMSLLVDMTQKLKGRPADDVKEADRTDFLGFLAEGEERQSRVFKQRLKQGVVEMYHVSQVFVPGVEVMTAGENPVAGTIESVSVVQGFLGPEICAIINVVHTLAGNLRPGRYTHRMKGFEGLKALSDLSLRIVSADEKDRLSVRGQLLRTFSKVGTYAHYQGSLVQPGFWGDQIFRADGRFVVDPVSFKRVEATTFNDMLRTSNVELSRDMDAGSADPSTVSDTEVWRCLPFLYGFSMTAKRWGRIVVNGLSAIAWREDAFEKLVMEEEQKELIHSLVKFHGVGFNDLIDGKGGGCILLLHGEPGQGKTLLAESVAEVLKKPLYSVSVGELGTNPDGLEERLRTILDVATIWDAVVLLDEADIFLEERDEKDIARNAMVGVFLRLLEYHNGVMFLTTNRVQNIDRAFYSRISVALRFDEADMAKRQKIWENLLDHTHLPVAWAEPLAAHKINGRQIKNAIRLAQTLALGQEREVTMADLTRAIGLALSFLEHHAKVKPLSA